MQIGRGGPVTVTHPECRRFLMTIREAVGLTLLAGLGGERGLFVLEMGEPIRVLDLARSMITLAGKVPEQDIPIVITGLRPGEKLDEQLMTEEEARSSRRIRDGILSVGSSLPPSDLRERIATLERLAAEGDRPGVLAALREALPCYTPGTEPEPAEMPAALEEEVLSPAEA
jgi:FlaA1/EpsC-like NDP-sugar epimerase